MAHSVFLFFVYCGFDGIDVSEFMLQILWVTKNSRITLKAWERICQLEHHDKQTKHPKPSYKTEEAKQR